MRKNKKDWHEEWVKPTSKECIELFDEIGCKNCLPVDRNRIRFSRVRRCLLDKQIEVIFPSDRNTTYSQAHGTHIGMRCPLDCAIRTDRLGNLRYEYIKSTTKRIKLKYRLRRAIKKYCSIIIILLVFLCSGCESLKPDSLSIGYSPPYYEDTEMWRGIHINLGYKL